MDFVTKRERERERRGGGREGKRGRESGWVRKRERKRGREMG